MDFTLDSVPTLGFGIATAILLVVSTVISWIDFRHMIVPDWANLILALAGLLCTGFKGQPWWQAVLQVCLLFAILLIIASLYRHLRHRDGLGMGDIKFVCAATMWIGIAMIPWLVLIASISALLMIVALQICGQAVPSGQRIPFGPHLCMGLLATWMAMWYGIL